MKEIQELSLITENKLKEYHLNLSKIHACIDFQRSILGTDGDRYYDRIKTRIDEDIREMNRLMDYIKCGTLKIEWLKELEKFVLGNNLEWGLDLKSCNNLHEFIIGKEKKFWKYLFDGIEYEEHEERGYKEDNEKQIKHFLKNRTVYDDLEYWFWRSIIFEGYEKKREIIRGRIILLIKVVKKEW